MPPGLTLVAGQFACDHVRQRDLERRSEVLHWTYNPTNANFDFLEPGDTLQLTFNAQVTDGHVTTANQPLTVNIVGTSASTVQGTDGNDVFVNVGGGVKVFGDGGSDTFQFKPGFGSATISDFNVATM